MACRPKSYLVYCKHRQDKLLLVTGIKNRKFFKCEMAEKNSKIRSFYTRLPVTVFLSYCAVCQNWPNPSLRSTNIILSIKEHKMSTYLQIVRKKSASEWGQYYSICIMLFGDCTRPHLLLITMLILVIQWYLLICIAQKYQSRERTFHLGITLTQQNPKILVHIPI